MLMGIVPELTLALGNRSPTYNVARRDAHAATHRDAQVNAVVKSIMFHPQMRPQIPKIYQPL